MPQRTKGIQPEDLVVGSTQANVPCKVDMKLVVSAALLDGSGLNTNIHLDGTALGARIRAAEKPLVAQKIWW